MDYNSCKNYLTDFLTDLKKGTTKDLKFKLKELAKVWKHYKDEP